MNNLDLRNLGSQLTAAGKSVAPNDYRQQEWAGATFSPDGEWLFVNIQTPGITFAITGPALSCPSRSPAPPAS
jgi:secreted PhoX family phosphatase